MIKRCLMVNYKPPILFQVRLSSISLAMNVIRRYERIVKVAEGALLVDDGKPEEQQQ
jgi:hypothetical protein